MSERERLEANMQMLGHMNLHTHIRASITTAVEAAATQAANTYDDVEYAITRYLDTAIQFALDHRSENPVYWSRYIMEAQQVRAEVQWIFRQEVQ